MRKTITLLAICMFTYSFANAQRDQTVFGHGGIDLTGVWGGSINNMTNFNDNFDISNGGYFVFEFNKKFLLGWTGYGSEATLQNGERADVKGRDLLLGYSINSYKPIHMMTYLQTGGGKLEIGESPSDQVFVVQPSIGVEANIFQWFKIGADAGYRFVTNVDTPGFNDADLSSPYVGLRLKFGWSWGSGDSRYDDSDFDDDF